MKKIRALIIILSVVLIFTSCNRKYENPSNTIIENEEETIGKIKENKENNSKNKEENQTETALDNLKIEENKLLEKLKGYWIIDSYDFDFGRYTIKGYSGIEFTDNEFYIYALDINEIIKYKYNIDEININNNYIKLEVYETSNLEKDLYTSKTKYKIEFDDDVIKFTKMNQNYSFGYFNFIKDYDGKVKEFKEKTLSKEIVYPSEDDKLNFLEKIKGEWIEDLSINKSYQAQIFNDYFRIETFNINEGVIERRYYDKDGNYSWTSSKEKFKIKSINEEENVIILDVYETKKSDGEITNYIDYY